MRVALTLPARPLGRADCDASAEGSRAHARCNRAGKDYRRGGKLYLPRSVFGTRTGLMMVARKTMAATSHWSSWNNWTQPSQIVTSEKAKGAGLAGDDGVHRHIARQGFPDSSHPATADQSATHRVPRPVLCRQELQQTVNAGLADLGGERLAIVRHQANAVHCDVKDLPA